METIVFNKEIYKLEAIKKAIEQYDELAEIKINEKDNEIEVVFDSIDQEVKEVLKDEFSNYVLGLMS